MPAKYLTRDQILSAKDLDTADVEVPEWGGTVTVRALGADERFDLMKELEMTPGDTELRKVPIGFHAKVAAITIVKPGTMEPMFTEKDIKELGKRSLEALQRVYDKVMELSGATEEAAEELGKESEKTTDSDSSSDLQLT